MQVNWLAGGGSQNFQIVKIPVSINRTTEGTEIYVAKNILSLDNVNQRNQRIKLFNN